MLVLTKRQLKHVVNVIMAKRKELFGEAGGNRRLAELIGVSPQLLSMWAYSKRIPSHRDLLALADVFEISLDELCRLNEGQKMDLRQIDMPRNPEPSLGEARESMVQICDIATEIVERQRLMLSGKRDYEKHNDWLRRISRYVDTM